MDLSKVLSDLATSIGLPLGGLVLLVLVDFLTGVLSALRRKVFDWSKLGDFFPESVLPQILGWVVLTASAYIASNAMSFLPPEVSEAIMPAVGGISYVAIVGVLGDSIFSNVKEISGAAPHG